MRCLFFPGPENYTSSTRLCTRCQARDLAMGSQPGCLLSVRTGSQAIWHSQHGLRAPRRVPGTAGTTSTTSFRTTSRRLEFPNGNLGLVWRENRSKGGVMGSVPKKEGFLTHRRAGAGVVLGQEGKNDNGRYPCLTVSAGFAFSNAPQRGFVAHRSPSQLLPSPADQCRPVAAWRRQTGHEAERGPSAVAQASCRACGQGSDHVPRIAS